MDDSTTQVSATISAATKEKLDRFTEEHGLKKNFVAEQSPVIEIAEKDEAGRPRGAMARS